MPRLLDLSHVTSSAVRDLIDLVNLTDFDRAHDQIKQVRGCTRPVQLIGSTATVNAATQEILRSYSTADEPTGRLLTACGNRRVTRCPPCSRIYAGDTFQLIKAGITGGKTVPETVRSHPRVFATLTAPSFGPVHGNRTTKAGKNLGCRCGRIHPDHAPNLGTPINPDRYDYAGAVLWNANAGALWARFTTYLRRYVARALGLPLKELKDHLRLSYAKVAEYQRRGLVHFHSVIRFDGPEGSTQPPPAAATTAVLTDAFKAAARQVSLLIDSTATGPKLMRWGEQIDIQEIPEATGDDAPLTDEAVAGYIAKYSTKGAETAGTVDRPLYCYPCTGTGHVTTDRGTTRPCGKCHGTGQAEPLEALKIHPHARRMIETCWELGGLEELAELRLRKWAHMLGFRGHFSTKSRRYSTTLGALRAARRAWHRTTDDTNPATSDETVLVLSDWRYLGSGYRPGERLLAAQVRHHTEELRDRARRVKTEGEPWL
ncbi:replication initiation protein [Streptomyces sp. VNUA116]|uniref:replication initiator n=1 Tax=Streptomyces sp. VNUA116 TaxID=3062449 RepID=UPI0026747B34|nr:replication initiator [Streptomyces sp. VNUA116]WKU45935.1 replication initiation protein [Streptomyces sp. VNUA116]